MSWDKKTRGRAGNRAEMAEPSRVARPHRRILGKVDDQRATTRELAIPTKVLLLAI
jgi:hypothetical protein